MDNTLENLIEELFDILLSSTQDMKSRVDKQLVKNAIKQARQKYEEQILPKVKEWLEHEI